jgi:hypothetical protein
MGDRDILSSLPMAAFVCLNRNDIYRKSALRGAYIASIDSIRADKD